MCFISLSLLEKCDLFLGYLFLEFILDVQQPSPTDTWRLHSSQFEGPACTGTHALLGLCVMRLRRLGLGDEWKTLGNGDTDAAVPSHQLFHLVPFGNHVSISVLPKYD